MEENQALFDEVDRIMHEEFEALAQKDRVVMLIAGTFHIPLRQAVQAMGQMKRNVDWLASRAGVSPKEFLATRLSEEEKNMILGHSVGSVQQKDQDHRRDPATGRQLPWPDCGEYQI